MKKLIIKFLAFASCPIILPIAQTEKPTTTSLPKETTTMTNEFYKDLLNNSHFQEIIKKGKIISEKYKVHPDIATEYTMVIEDAYNQGRSDAIHATGRYFQNGLNMMAQALQPEKK